MSKCVAIVGANGVGKSTLAARLAALEGGRMPPAQAHEIAIAEFSFLGDSWTVLDCPGSVEFMQQAMDALLVADIAVIWSRRPRSRRAGGAVHPAGRAGEGADCAAHQPGGRGAGPGARLVAALQGYSRHPVVLRQMPIREDGRIVGAVDLVPAGWKYRDGEPCELIQIPAGMLDASTSAGASCWRASRNRPWLLEELIDDARPRPARSTASAARCWPRAESSRRSSVRPSAERASSA